MKVEIELNDLNNLNDRILDLETELANQTYMGNSIGYIYDKMKAYKNMTGKLSDFVRDGVANGYISMNPNRELTVEIAKLCGIEIDKKSN